MAVQPQGTGTDALTQSATAVDKIVDRNTDALTESGHAFSTAFHEQCISRTGGQECQEQTVAPKAPAGVKAQQILSKYSRS
jgi:hypothetical protein